MEKRLHRAASTLAGILYSRNSDRVVFAESCTAGLISAALASVPGISNYLCGSFVTYRESAKQAMLAIPTDVLEEHTAVSAEVSGLMATNSLQRISEATFSTAITGHLGPGAPEALDGKIFVAIAVRETGGDVSDVELKSCNMFRLTGEDRLARQREAASIAIEQLSDLLRVD